MDNPIRLHWLDPRDPHQPFPPAHRAMRDPNGLLAIGGDLSVPRLIRAYSNGIFPWFNPNEPILWWCPDPRAVLAPAEFHVSHSLAKRLRKADFAVTLDLAFAEVLEGCSDPGQGRNDTWLGPAMKQAYCELHELGFAHSVEVWQQGELMGGLYGVSLGGAFFGESMFSRASDTSKIALAMLCRQLAEWRFSMIDCQIASSHLGRLGAHEISRERFLTELRRVVGCGGRTGLWRFEIPVPAAKAHLPVTRSILPS